MIHAYRTEDEYEFLARNISAAIKHKTIRACVSDGEKAIQKGFRRAQCFKDCIWLVCMIHARDNCKRKLEEIGVEAGTSNRILSDIYGFEVECEGVRTRKGGLVDLLSQEQFMKHCKKHAGTNWKQTTQGIHLNLKSGSSATRLKSA